MLPKSRYAWTALVGLLSLIGCAPRSTTPGTPVTDAWSDPTPPESTGEVTSNWSYGDAGATGGSATTQPVKKSSPIMTVNGSPVSGNLFIRVLVQGHGLALLENLVVLEAAKQLAAERAIAVTQKHIDTAYEKAIGELAGPAPATQSTEDRQAFGERLLTEFLRRKNISRLEYMLGIERTAYLERIVEADVAVTEAELKAEYDRKYGERVQVRHIQVRTLDDVKKVRRLLGEGNRFDAVARRHSQNLETALAGGLLPPFTAEDPDVPQLMALTAFHLKPGDISAPIQDGAWYHILVLERRFPPSSVEFRHVRDELREPARRRLMRPRVQRLAERLFREAKLKIHDGELRRQFTGKHPDRPRPGQ